MPLLRGARLMRRAISRMASTTDPTAMVAASAGRPADDLDPRARALLRGIDLEREIGLEIGPLDKPLVRRIPGRPIFYADYTTREVLRRNSAADPHVDCDRIPEIDYVIAPLPEALDRRFDYIVASHVIEHVPNMLGWICTLLGWLKPDGKLVLAIPDRRYCFDYLRTPSTTGEVMEAFFEKREKPPFASIYDGMRQAVHLDTERAWSEAPYRGPFDPIFSASTAFAVADRARRDGTYQDCHCWVFTHSSFLQLIREINELNVASVRIASDTAPIARSNEFHVVLAPGA